MRYAALALVGAFALFLGASVALAHSWYPHWCCNDDDCRELFEEQGEIVQRAPGGWRLWDGRFVPRESARPSPDSRFHLCEEVTTKAIICFFAPPDAS
jgi:hypothetical protein